MRGLALALLLLAGCTGGLPIPGDLGEPPDLADYDGIDDVPDLSPRPRPDLSPPSDMSPLQVACDGVTCSGAAQCGSLFFPEYGTGCTPCGEPGRDACQNSICTKGRLMEAGPRASGKFFCAPQATSGGGAGQACASVTLLCDVTGCDPKIVVGCDDGFYCDAERGNTCQPK